MKRQTPKEFMQERVNLPPEEFEKFWNDLGNFCYAQAIENGYFNNGIPALVFRGHRVYDKPTGFIAPNFDYTQHPGDCLNLHKETPIGEPYGVYADRYKEG